MWIIHFCFPLVRVVRTTSSVEPLWTLCGTACARNWLSFPYLVIARPHGLIRNSSAHSASLPVPYQRNKEGERADNAGVSTLLTHGCTGSPPTTSQKKSAEAMMMRDDANSNSCLCLLNCPILRRRQALRRAHFGRVHSSF